MKLRGPGFAPQDNLFKKKRIFCDHAQGANTMAIIFARFIGQFMKHFCG
jgi:hypothetical protein